MLSVEARCSNFRNKSRQVIAGRFIANDSISFATNKSKVAAVVVMLMTPPRNIREWTVGLISTVVSSICGGAITVEYFQLHHWAFSTIGLYAMGGVIFACGLPGWALVRWLFNFIEQRRDESIDEVAKDVKELF